MVGCNDICEGLEKGDAWAGSVRLLCGCIKSHLLSFFDWVTWRTRADDARGGAEANG